MAENGVGGGGGQEEHYVPPNCVIASSNRENDIRPYCDILYATDGHKWGGVMPQEYPTRPTRDEEEVFLRQYFTEDEIHMQGGASGEGNGFRFLKQVWWSIAIYNFQVRIPQMVDWWFKDNQDVLTDQLSHLLKPDATSSTFFQQPEIESCGKKFLDVVSKAIQWTLRHGDENHPPAINAAPVSAISTKTEPELAAQEPSVTTTATELPTPKSAPLPLKPTAQNFDTQSPWSANPTGQIRNFSDHASSMPPQPYQQPQRGGQQRKRGSYNKRGSFHDPATFRPDLRNINPQAHAPGYPPPPQPFLHGGPYVQPNQVRGPSFCGPPPVQEFVPGGMPAQPMPGPYPPGNFDPSVHAMPYPPPDQAFMPGPTGYGNYPDAAYPQPYQAQPFGERTNGQYFGRGDHEGQKNRRESVSSRAGKRSGYGTHNGRGNKSSRGRNSIGYGDARLSLRNSSNDFNAPAEDMHPRDRRFSVSNKYRQDSWRNTKQDENTMPGSGPPDEIHRPFVPQSRDLQATSVSDDWLLHNCTKNQIGEKCTYVNKLIVFNVPRDVPEQVIVSFFANFGPVYSVARQGTQPNAKGFTYEKPLVYVNFAQDNKSQGARACLQPRQAPWGSLRAEVPREYWDPQHERYSQRDTAGNEINPRQALNRFQHGRLSSAIDQSHYPGHFPMPSGPEPTFASGTRPDMTTAETAPQPLQPLKTTNGSDDASEDTTPTASGAATPNRKKGKKNKNKNKNKNKKVGLYQESLNQAFEANALKNGSLPDVAQDDKVFDGGVKAAAVDGKYNDTPMQPTPTQHGSPESKNALPETNAQGVTEALPELDDPLDSKTDGAEATVDTSESSIPSSTTLDHEHESPSQQPDSASKDVKAEDEQGDDSFVTASGTPEEVKAESPETVSPVDIPVSLDKAVSIPQQGSASKVVEPPAAVSSTPEDSTLSQKDVKKAPIPQALSKSISQPAVAVPKPSSSKAVSDQSEGAVQTELHATPDDPSVLVTGSTAAPNPQVSKNAEPQPSQTKKTPKVKGPAQTDSFSMYGKKAKVKAKKPDKGPKGQDPQPMPGEKTPKVPTPAPTPVQPVTAPEPLKETPEELKARSPDDSEVALPQKPEAPTPVNADASTGKNVFDKMTGKVNDFLSYVSQSGSSVQESRLKQDGVEQAPELDQVTAHGHGHQDDPASLTNDYAVDGAELEPESSKTSKAKKNKSKKKKGKAKIDPNDAIPTKADGHDAGMAPTKEPVKAEIVEMSYPASCTETKSPIYQFRGSQALNGESNQASQAPEQSSSSPLRSPARKNQHLLTGEAKPNSRQHKRIRSGKSSDSANSSDEKALVTQKASESEQNKNRDAVQQSLGARFPTDQESLGLGITQQSRALGWNQEMPYNVSALGKRVIPDHAAHDEPTISDEVKRAIEREKEMAAKEQRLKKGKPEGGKANVK